MHNFIWFFFRVFEEVGSVSTIPDSLRLKIPAPSFGGMFFRMILALTIIIILIYLVAYVFKKLSKQGMLSTSIDPNAKILGTFSLNNKQQIYVVFLFEEILILASSPESCTLIDKISDKEKIKKILDSKGENKSLQFSDILEKIKGKKSEKK